MVLDTSRILSSPHRLSMPPPGQAKFPVHWTYPFFMVHFHNFLTYLTLVPIDIVITSAGPGKVSCADNGQLGIFVAHFRNFLPQCCAAKNCFLVWKFVKGNQERTETTLFANAKVQSISRTWCTSFCVVLCRYVEKVGNSKLKVKMKIKDL